MGAAIIYTHSDKQDRLHRHIFLQLGEKQFSLFVKIILTTSPLPNYKLFSIVIQSNIVIVKGEWGEASLPLSRPLSIIPLLAESTVSFLAESNPRA